jgi:hypothetical protein
MKETAFYKLIQGQQEIIGNFQLSVEQQEKLSQLYNHCFELQKQQIIDAFIEGRYKKQTQLEKYEFAEQYYNETFNK